MRAELGSQVREAEVQLGSTQPVGRFLGSVSTFLTGAGLGGLTYKENSSDGRVLCARGVRS